MDDRTVVLWNSAAGSADGADEALEILKARPEITIRDTESGDDLRRAVREAVAAGTRRLIAAGGDGTVQAVVNALPEGCNQSLTLGVLPLGTGNDLARTLAMPLEAVAAVRVLLETAQPRRIDLVEVITPHRRRLCMNMATGGNSEKVQARLTDTLKRRWGGLVYLRNTLLAITDLVAYEVELRLDDLPVEKYQVLNLAIANGRTCAGGVQLAPCASLEDGQLEVTLIRDGSPLDMAALATDYFVGQFLQNELVVRRRARQVQVTAEPVIQFSLDGEPLAEQPVTFNALPQALEVLVGPDYVAQPLGCD